MKSLSLLPDALRAALDKKGYASLTAVQEAVLDPALAGHDLRISSQTGSGKTLAIGFVIRELVEAKPQGPVALVIAPTRELAQQTRAELSWLYAGLGAKVIALTGGAGYREELRALAAGPAVVVGTPGRLFDHLERGSFVPTHLGAVVLDEADRMLEMGFREELEAIFAKLPAERHTHLVSATFPRAVEQLARSVQRGARTVEGTRLGEANRDIDHVLYPVHANDRLDAIVNLMLVQPGARTLVFARTRAGVAELGTALTEAGFAVSVLSGELEQAARNRALAAFKAERAQILVATDVAARGIDVQDIAQVIHADPPTDADMYTHRSGRTGRAGRKGKSAVLVTPASAVKVSRILRQARIDHRFESLPTAEALRRSADTRLLEALLREEDDAGDDEQSERSGRALELARRVLDSDEPLRAVTRLVQRSQGVEGIEPRDVRSPEPPRPQRPAHDARGPARGRDARGASRAREDRPAAGGDRWRERQDGPREEGFVRFRVSWGGEHGAEPHRVLAMVCRRGDIQGRAVGAIRVEPRFSLVDVRVEVAEAFARSAARPDPRDRRVIIAPERAEYAERGRGPAPRHRAAPRGKPAPERAAPRSVGGQRAPKRKRP